MTGVLDQIIAALRREIGSLQASALDTPAPDYPAYRQMVGHHAGLKQALDIIETALEEDDERRNRL